MSIFVISSDNERHTLKPQDGVNQVRIILVEPGESRNIGSVLRAMSNFDFSELHVVSPRNYDETRVRATACNAESSVERIHFSESLEQSVADCSIVVGFSAQEGKNRLTHQSLETFISEWEVNPGKVALVFGPEDHGLRREHIALCSLLVQIETRGKNSSLNLAHAVCVVLYQISRTALSDEESSDMQHDLLSSQAEIKALDSLAEELAYRSGFFGPGTPDQMADVLRQLIRRVRPTARELKILCGLASRSIKSITGEVPTSPFPPSDEQRVGYASKTPRGSCPTSSKSERDT